MTLPLWLILSLAAPGAEAARAWPSRPAVALGEPFEYALALRHREGERVELLPPPDLSPFALAGQACREAELPGEGPVAICTLRLQLLDLGEHQVPPLRLRVTGSSGERFVAAPGAAVRALPATDAAAPAGAIPLREPEPPPVPWPLSRLLPAALAALLALLAALLLRRALRRRRLARPAAPRIAPHERLAREVAEILALGLPARGRGAELLQGLAAAVRGYLAAASPRAALDLTTAELLAALAFRPVPGIARPELARLLGAADLSKFARHQPSPGECLEAEALARALVERTRPPPAGRGEAA